MKYSTSIPIYWMPSKKKTVLVGLNWWRNAHFQVLNKAKKFYHELLRLDFEGEPPFEGPVKVHYKVYVRRKGTDGNNVGALMSKYFLDGMVSIGVLPDDNIDFVVRESFEYAYDKEFPRCDVTVSSIVEDDYEL